MQNQNPYPPYYAPPKRGVKDFFMMMFASMIGFMIASFALSLISFGILFLIIGLVSSTETAVVSPGSILKITMSEKIVDSPQNEDDIFAQLFADETGKKISLQDYVNAIIKAKDDDNIKAIYLEVSDANGDLANLDEIRSALENFKKSGKKVIAYSDFYGLRGLYIASVAEKIYLNPRGGILFKGLGAEVPMFKTMLNSIGVEAQVIRAGKYKSAVEPFIANEMSVENKTQLREYLTGLWGSILEKISVKTGLNISKLNALADSLAIFDPSSALTNGVVDGLIYRSSLDSVLKAGFGLKEDLKFISLSKYLKTGAGHFEYNSSDNVRIIYAEGDIVTGKGGEDNIGADPFIKAVRDAAEDESVKAVVLRVNSPGGSALASDMMYRELLKLKAKKPLIISMGNYAASGGYYISAAGDLIVASKNTLTGSIGVFGLVMSTQKLFRDKIGISFDTVKTNLYSDFFTGVRPMSPYELGVMQMSVDTTYDVFLECVSQGRKLTKEEVNEIGQGRIWFAPAAKENRLVDSLGGLFDAVKIAASKAKLKDYSVTYSTTSETFFEKLLKNLESKMSFGFEKVEMAKKLEVYVKEMEKISKMNGVMMLMPYQFVW
jgi:protease-4